MALDWSSYLVDPTLSESQEWWPEISTPQPANRSTATAPTSNLDQSNIRFMSEAEGTINPFEGQKRIEPYDTDASYRPDDYFLSDLEVLQPFTDDFANTSTSQSSPEVLSANDVLDQTLFTQSPLTTASSNISAPLRNSLPRSVSFSSNRPSPAQRSTSGTKIKTEPDALFPVDSSFIDNLSSLDNSIQQVSLDAGDFTTKRSKQSTADSLSACWTSPLCPNHTEDGPPPDPTTCGGACAPFLFAEESNNPPPMEQILPRREISILKEFSKVPSVDSVELKHQLVEDESDSSNPPPGRVFVKNSKKGSMTSSVPRTNPLSTHEEESTSPEAPMELSDRNIAKPRGRLPHNQVERKYRESLNAQLEGLKRVVPSLQPQAQQLQNGIDIEDLPVPTKPSKAIVLASATAYIKQMEKEKKKMNEENQMLRSRIKALQALVKCDDCSLMQYVMNLKVQPPQL